MGWTDEFRFRDCTWCGLQHAELRLIAGPGLETIDLKVKEKPVRRWWAAVACPRCGGAMLIEHNHPEHATPEQLKVVPDSTRDPGIKFLPDQVEAYYLRAIRALDSGEPDYAMLDLRKALESICKDLLPEEKRIQPGRNRELPLSNQIRSLIELNMVTTEVGAALHKVRELTNIGSHVVEVRGIQLEVNLEKAENALGIAMQVLRLLYEIPKEIEGL